MTMFIGRLLYHLVSTPSVDGWLYPLNVLKDKYPKLYQQHVRKYEGREHVMQKRIPIFDCLWNDVLFLSAVSPQEVVQALHYAGGNPRSLQYYAFSDRWIEADNCVVYLYDHDDHEDPAQYIPYKPGLITQCASLPEKTVAYYRQAIAAGERPLLYRYVPHFLYRGVLYVGNNNVMTAKTLYPNSS